MVKNVNNYTKLWVSYEYTIVFYMFKFYKKKKKKKKHFHLVTYFIDKIYTTFIVKIKKYCCVSHYDEAIKRYV